MYFASILSPPPTAGKERSWLPSCYLGQEVGIACTRQHRTAAPDGLHDQTMQPGRGALPEDRRPNRPPPNPQPGWSTTAAQ
jgi:hypothetical protein